jgi:CheY-like chemotaxis protein
MTQIAAKEKNPEKIKEHLNKVEASSQLLLSVINDVLDMSKIEAGKLEVNKAPFDFNSMLDNAGSIVKIKMDEKKHQFTIKHDPSIKNKVISDEHRLLQVIVNLLNNAMKFTPENGEISLAVTQKKIDEKKVKLRVEVRDSGIGLTNEQQKKLFAAFEQADSSITRKYGGTGLGLAICKKIINMLDGDIWVKSRLHQGACFFFELEAELGEFLSNSSIPAEHQADDNDITVDWSGFTVLLAEDVEINREIVMMMLADTGIKIVCAENGQIAVDKFSVEPDLYDLVLMDMQMPVLDGISATKFIRTMKTPKAGQIPIIAMTANAFKEDIDACIEAGMNEHIAKPFVFDNFVELLGKYLK